MPGGRIGRALIWLLAFIVLLPLLGIAGGYVWWSRSLPELDGEAALKGLAREVEVIRDRHGVPHIFAQNLQDASRALGYLHAQDRYFQMDITRRVTQGRLAEVIGSRGLPLDRLFRTLDLDGRAAASFKSLSPELKAHLQAYADGVNAWLDESAQALPIEYMVLD
ncbi:MAG: penicillin acylase family protein [Rhodomicrobium sp.]|nr:penicillin acylase family protein [Rhodomicrobium sp.]